MTHRSHDWLLGGWLPVCPGQTGICPGQTGVCPGQVSVCQGQVMTHRPISKSHGPIPYQFGASIFGNGREQSPFGKLLVIIFSIKLLYDY
jgi:hypothetical protein